MYGVNTVVMNGCAVLILYVMNVRMYGVNTVVMSVRC